MLDHAITVRRLDSSRILAIRAAEFPNISEVVEINIKFGLLLTTVDL